MIFQNALDNEETEEKTSCWDHTYWWLKTAKIQGPFIVLPLCNKVVGRIFWQYRRALGGVWSDQMTKVQILGFGNARMYKVRYCQGILQQAVLTEKYFILVLSLSNALWCNLHKNGQGRGLFIWWENALHSHTKKNSFLIIATPYNESLDSIVPVILRSTRPFRGQDRVKQTSSAKFHDHL